jgi:predicted aldo/keto reductase-like oxidoreductase
MASGVNYFDTAYTYRGSEAFAGRALSRYPRESYCLATKCPPWMLNGADDFERIFAESLARCQTDYFDFFLVHNLAQEARRAALNEEYLERFIQLRMYDMLQKKKAEGKIRHIGFSFHGEIPLLRQLTQSFSWDFAQIQLNYIDWKALEASTQYEILTERNIPVVVMEPLRGGALASLNEESAKILKAEQPGASLASWGIRYAASLPNVITVLSGMSAMEQLKDNIAAMDSFLPVSEREKELLDKASVIYHRSGAIPCTGCGYCAPCGQGVAIPRVFSIYNHYKLVNFRIPFDNGYSTLTAKEKASNCTQCGECAKKCPQHIDIPGYMKEINAFANEPA